MASVTNYKQNPDELMEDTHSGLVNYLFGKDRKKEINRETMHELQQKLMDDVLWLEFTRYSKDGKTISEVDFCTHLLLCANITSKKKKKMVQFIQTLLSLYHYIFRIIFTYILRYLQIFLSLYNLQIKRVKKEGHAGQGITFEGFKAFYNVLFGGADLERAMFFLDTEKNGINR